MSENFVVQELVPYEGWNDLIEFDDMNAALNYIENKIKSSVFFHVEYRIIVVFFDTQIETIKKED